ncbi:MAG: hypothetical protein E6X17_10725 [Sporomusaceae bacterium]|nr:hypothetical protein [Sporomusaceae bacterium]
MAKEDFKNAAAKLLAQHAATAKRPSVALQVAPKPEPDRAEIALSVPADTKVSDPIRLEPEPVPSAAAAAVPEWVDAYQPSRSSRLKVYSTAGLAIAGCAITVLLVPETIFGIAGNAVVGLATGAGLGWIINREF